MNRAVVSTENKARNIIFSKKYNTLSYLISAVRRVDIYSR